MTLCVRAGLVVVPSLALALLAGCSSREGDDDVPTPVGVGCPDLAGTYAAIATSRDDFNPIASWTRDAAGGKWAAITLDTIDPGSPIHLRLIRDVADMNRLANDFRTMSPDRYDAWRRVAATDPNLMGRSDRAFAEALAELGPSQEHVVSYSGGFCGDGWLRFEEVAWGINVPQDADRSADQRKQGLSFGIDADGALLVREEIEYRYEFPIWCGDGCKGIPYSTKTYIRWAKLARTDPPKRWRWSASPMAQDEPRDLPDAIGDTDPRVTALRRLVVAALPKGGTMFNFKGEQGDIVFSGTCPTQEDFDRLKVFIGKQSDVTGVSIGRQYENNRGHVDFRLTINLVPSE